MIPIQKYETKKLFSPFVIRFLHKKYYFVRFIVLIIAVFFYVFFNTKSSSKLQTVSVEVLNKNMPLILYYTPLKNIGFTVEKITAIFSQCQSRCMVSDNPRLYPYSDLTIFHSRQAFMSEFLRQHQNPNRLNVFLTTEAYPHERIRKKNFPKDFFNVTWTFRQDSTLPRLYDWFQKIMPNEKENETLVWNDEMVEKELLKKKKLAVQFVSHCITHSLREKLTDDIASYANISIFGSCNGVVSKNESEELAKHFFYLAFENAVCKDYVTEKFWKMKQLIVPVVMKRSLLQGLVEDEYFIAVDDFDSTKKLVDKLIHVSQNMNEYKKYLGWTKIYKKTPAYNDNLELCKLCDMAVQKEKHLIPNIYDWWENESECQFNYMNFTLKYFSKNLLLK